MRRLCRASTSGFPSPDMIARAGRMCVISTAGWTAAALASEHRLPAIHLFRQFAHGGLVVYGPDLMDLFRRSSYVDKDLKGTKPSDLPVEQPTKVALVINMKTAKALGLTVPPSLLVCADE